jgi:hypothetical protein
LRDLVGDGFGLGDLLVDRDGDGLGECDGLGLVLAAGLVELVLLLGLDELVGLCDALLVGLGVPEVLALFDALMLGLFDALMLGLLDALTLGLVDALVLVPFDGLELAGIPSKLADSTASALCPHGDAIGRDEDARAGATVKPNTRNDPATRLMAMRPTRMTSTGTDALRSPGRLQPNRDAGGVPCPQASGFLTVRLGGHVSEHKLAARLTEGPRGNARAIRLIMILFRQCITSVFEMAV